MKTKIVKQDINSHFLFGLLDLLGHMPFYDQYINDTIKALLDYIESKLDFGGGDIVNEYVVFEVEELQ